MRKVEVIDSTLAEWTILIFFVSKKDGTLCFCFNNRNLNAAMARDSNPVSRMDECIDLLGDAAIFTTLDCNGSYW